MAMLVLRSKSVRNLGFHVDSKEFPLTAKGFPAFSCMSFVQLILVLEYLLYLSLSWFILFTSGLCFSAYWFLCRISIQLMVCWAHQFGFFSKYFIIFSLCIMCLPSFPDRSLFISTFLCWFLPCFLRAATLIPLGLSWTAFCAWAAQWASGLVPFGAWLHWNFRPK